MSTSEKIISDFDFGGIIFIKVNLIFYKYIKIRCYIKSGSTELNRHVFDIVAQNLKFSCLAFPT